MPTLRLFAAFALTCLLTSGAIQSQELYRNALSSGTGLSSDTTDADALVTYGYDYSADGLPEAPNSRTGDTATRGIKLEANIVEPGAATLITVYPTGELFSGNYQFRFDAWSNYDVDERINGASSGTAEFLGGGLGYDEVSADIGAGFEFLATGDGGSGSDWRIFADGAFLGTEEMAADARNGLVDYYADFLPGVVPPGDQAQDAFPAGAAGSPGFQWLTHELTTFGDRATHVIEKPNGDRLEIAHFYANDRPFSSVGNVRVIYADLFSSVTTRADLTFGIIDNLEVRAIGSPPAPCLNTNLGVPDCSFEDPDLDSWSLELGDSFAHSSRPALSGLGSGELDAAIAPARGLDLYEAEISSSCFLLDGSTLDDYRFEASFRLVSGAVSGGACRARLEEYAETDCSVGVATHDGSAVTPSDVDAWITSEGNADVSGSGSARLKVQCFQSSEDFVVQVDDALANRVVFQDGFENGNTFSWSSTVP